MPLYEYYCAECQTKFEARRLMDEADAAIACKSCDSPRTSRVLSLFATVGSKSRSSTQAMSEGFGGGCCGGGSCGCRH